MIDLSVVIPTYNRLSKLSATVGRLRMHLTMPHEIVVVDGGSTDGTREFLAADGGLHVVLEARREGAVRAFNKGFRVAQGEHVMWLNDDAYPLMGSVEAALAMLGRHESIGMVGFYHDWDRDRNVLDSVHRDGRRYSFFNVRGYPYANFGLLRRELIERVGYADERYFFFGFDPDLALKIQIEAGLKVVGCREALVAHEEYHDDRKLSDLDAGAQDNCKLFAKWDLPEKDSYPDPQGPYFEMLSKLGIEYERGKVPAGK